VVCVADEIHKLFKIGVNTEGGEVKVISADIGSIPKGKECLP